MLPTSSGSWDPYPLGLLQEGETQVGELELMIYYNKPELHFQGVIDEVSEIDAKA